MEGCHSIRPQQRHTAADQLKPQATEIDTLGCLAEKSIIRSMQ